MPGTNLGPILPAVAELTGIHPNTPVIAPGTHDTASAVVAVPVAEGAGNRAYLSSGTRTPVPIILAERRWPRAMSGLSTVR